MAAVLSPVILLLMVSIFFHGNKLFCTHKFILQVLQMGPTQGELLQ